MSHKRTARKTPRSRAATTRNRKKAYVAPKVIEYGTVAKLTAVKPGSIADGTNSTLKL